MNKKLNFLFFCMIIVGAASHAQDSLSNKRIYLLNLRPHFYKLAHVEMKFPLNNENYIQQIPANFYSKNLGFFCRQELKMDKSLKIPMRFRLGSIEQCNWLEGKRR